MIELDFIQKINAPVERVFAYVTDLQTAVEWQDGVMESSRDADTKVGTRIKIVRRLMGQRLDTTGEVTEFVPNKRFAFRSSSGPVQYNVSQTFLDSEGSTKLQTHMEMDPGGALQISDAMIASDMKEEFVSQEKKLKQILES